MVRPALSEPVPCPSCGSTAPARARGLQGSEILGTVLVVFLTCGLGFPVLLGLPLLASRKVCPACNTER